MSEIRNIKWSSITEYGDGSAYITIQNSIIDIDGKPFEKKSTKVDTRTRRLRIPKYILNLIHSTERTSEYLINLSGSAIYQRFTRLIEKNGLQHMTFHDLRHPYVKHTTKIYFCKSRNPKPPNTTDGLGFLFLLSYIPVNWHQILVI